MKFDPIFRLRAGAAALAHIRTNGLTPRDIACIPAAAGGPKGLTLLPLDRFLHREWLNQVPDLELIGASIGAWRATALAQPDPLPALDRLQRAYVHEQNYSARPGPDEVATVCRDIVAATLGEAPLTVRKGLSLSIITARARGALAGSESRLAFARAVLSNSVSRNRLAAHLQRVVFRLGDAARLTEPFDPFGLEAVALTADNERDALLASGTIPLLCRPVRDIAGAPPGNYWDGALVDYHLVLPYQQITRSDKRRRIVFYPHFNDYMTQG
jgi:predicted acylesterase/phospholipase RssA